MIKWSWHLANANDVKDIVALAQRHFETEINEIFTPDPLFYAYNVNKAITEQSYYSSKGQLIVARNKETYQLLAYAWLVRGGQTMYAQEELAEAAFVHMDLTLSTRTRVCLTEEILDHWIRWCRATKIPVLVSTSIRREQTAFMRIHERKGFLIRGSIAYKRITNE